MFREYCSHCRVEKDFRVSEHEGITAVARCPTCTSLISVTKKHRARAVQTFDFG